MIALHNRLWSVVCNQSVSPGQPGGVEFSVSGDTAIFGPNGRLDCEAPFGSNAEALSSHSF